MDRRYYSAKFAIVIAAVVLALAGSGMSTTTQAPRGPAQYSAPAQLQDAAWHATGSAARTLVCLASRALRNLAEVAP